MYPVSANIVAFNEGNWLPECIKSIIDYVDEIIYVDSNSTDNSLEIVRGFNSPKIKVYTYEDHKLNGGIGERVQFGKAQSKNKLVLRMDGDFVAYDSLPKLFDFCLSKQEKYCCFWTEIPNVYGDIYHTNPDPQKQSFNHDAVNNGPVSGHHCFAKELQDQCGDGPFLLHMNNLKAMRRHLYRAWWLVFEKETGTNCTPDRYEEWLYNRWKNGKETTLTVQEFVKDQIKILKRKPIELTAFDFSKWGPHPSYVENSKAKDIFNLREQDEKFYLDYPDDYVSNIS